MLYYLGPPRSPEEWLGYYQLRYSVLRAPLGLPPGSERDPSEPAAWHALGLHPTGRALAVGRLQVREPGLGQIRYMAVQPDWQGRGLAAQVVRYLETIARQHGLQAIMLNAREPVLGFYHKQGYSQFGKPFSALGIPHRSVHKVLKA